MTGGRAGAFPRRRAAFVDKDGTLVEDVPYNVDPSLLRFTPQAPQALRTLADAGYAIVIVSNQPGLALGRFTLDAMLRLRDALLARLHEEAGVRVTAMLVCPHAPSPADADGLPGGCTCRKPWPGMLLAAAAEHGLALDRSWMVGDILDDVEAGHRAGCRTVLLNRGNETEWRLSPRRRPDLVCGDLAEAAQRIVAADARRAVQ